MIPPAPTRWRRPRLRRPDAAPSPGSLVDTSLQPGNGSADVIVGGHFYRPLMAGVDGFVNAMFQAAIAQRPHQSGQDFRPGNTQTLSDGVRVEAAPTAMPQLQINVFRKSRDQGALADNPNSAGMMVYLSPGVTVAVMDGLQAFAFVQLPVNSHLDRYQLTPRWTASAGVSYAF